MNIEEFGEHNNAAQEIHVSVHRPGRIDYFKDFKNVMILSDFSNIDILRIYRY